jgi:hypothetical protein
MNERRGEGISKKRKEKMNKTQKEMNNHSMKKETLTTLLALIQRLQETRKATV